jgi:CBS domain-containing protein
MRICDLIKNQETYQADIGQTVLETVRAMVERNIGAVPVLRNGQLVGIFSERDLMKRWWPRAAILVLHLSPKQ